MSSTEGNSQSAVLNDSPEVTTNEHADAQLQQMPSTSNAPSDKIEEPKHIFVVNEVRDETSQKDETNSDACVPKSKYKSDLMKASDLHCPFVWQKDLNILAYQDHDIDLMSTSEEMFEESGFRFRRFIVNLVLCYHNFYRRNIKDSINHLEEMEKMMNISSRRESHDTLFNLINDALYHVIHSCRIYILQTTDQKQKAEKVLMKIKSYDTMSDVNKAGLWAIRANVYVEYGYEGVKNAILYIGKAIKQDPENAFWHFMKGMFMGRLRRMDGGLVIPHNEEFEALRMAIDKREDPAFIAFTAEAYLETAKTAKKLYLHKLRKTDKDTEKMLSLKLNELNEVAARYFKHTINLKPNSSHLLFRCGKGLINLPPPFQDVQAGLNFIRKGLSISPDSSYGNHAMAIYLEKIEKKPALAKEYLDISAKKKNFPALIDFIRIEFIETKDTAKLWKQLEKLLDEFPEMPKRRRILGEIISYYLFVDYDLVEACFYMKKLICLNTKAVYVINRHKSMILPLNDSIPLSDIILNRIKKCLEQSDLPNLDREVFKKYVQFLVEEDIASSKISDNVFSKLQKQIENGFKNKEMKLADQNSKNARKRVHDVNEFEEDACPNPAPKYLDYYRSDMGRVNKKTTGDEATDVFNKMYLNPLPRRRRTDETTSTEHREPYGDAKTREENNGDRYPHHPYRRQEKKSSKELSATSRRRRRNSSPSRSESSTPSTASSEGYRRKSRGRRHRSRSSSSSSSSTASSEEYRRKSREHHHRSRSVSSGSSTSSASSSEDYRRKSHRRRHHRSSSSVSSTSSGSDDYSRKSARRQRRHHRSRSMSSSASSDNNDSGNKRRQKGDRKKKHRSDVRRGGESSPFTAKGERAKSRKFRRRHSSSNNSSDSESSVANRNASLTRGRADAKRRDSDEKATENEVQPSDCIPKTTAELRSSVERLQASMHDLSVDDEAKASRKNLCERNANKTAASDGQQRAEVAIVTATAGAACGSAAGGEVSDRSCSARSGHTASRLRETESSRSKLIKHRRKDRDRSRDSDRSVKTTSSRVSDSKRRSSPKRKSRDHSVDSERSVRTDRSRMSRKHRKSSGNRRSSSGGSSTVRNSGRDRRTVGGERSARRDAEQRPRSQSVEKTSKKGDVAAASVGRSERQLAGSPRRKHGRGKNNRDVSGKGDYSSDRYSSKKRAAKHNPSRTDDSSGSSDDSVNSKRKGKTAGKEKSRQQSSPQLSKNSKKDERRRRKEGDDRDRRSKYVSSQLSDS